MINVNKIILNERELEIISIILDESYNSMLDVLKNRVYVLNNMLEFINCKVVYMREELENIYYEIGVKIKLNEIINVIFKLNYLV